MPTSPPACGPAGVLAVHARRRAGQRPAAVPHPRALVRDAPEPPDRLLHASSRTRSTRAGRSTSSGRGTVFMAIPTFYYAFLDRPEFREAAKGWAHVRLFTCGSAPIRPEVLPELESILGRPVINRYGMTEGHVITSLPLDGPWPQGSVGLPLDGDRGARRRRRRHARGRRARSARSSSAGRTCSASTGAGPTPPARRSPRAGSTPATWAARRATGSSPWSAARTT